LRILDLVCGLCGNEQEDVAIEGDLYPPCRCGGEMDWLPSKLNTDIWGQEKYIQSLDITTDKSGLRKYLKDHDLSECGDRVGGARTETVELGKTLYFDMKG